ncbi:MAG: hypothetical protein J7L99_00915 [Planctomycetes bacterium]|nr:hypothetical protein [Planctomycetota bacterium]
MDMVTVACKYCGKGVRVPVEYIGKKGKCPQCGRVFEITPARPSEMPESAQPGSTKVSEQEILSWLMGGPTEPVKSAAPESNSSATVTKTKSVSAVPRRSAISTGTVSKGHFPVRLGHVDEMGAFFLFDPSLLYNEQFRLSFPRRCVVCGNPNHLSVHLVVWTSKLPDRGKLGVHNTYSRSIFKLDDLGDVKGRELLEKLDRFDNVPEPFSLPFPYYLCRRCSPVGAIITDVRPRADGNGEICELGISSIRQAEEFARNVCGPDSPVVKKVHEAYLKLHSNPWQTLPLAVRSRIKHWFTPQQGETFKLYIQDGDFSKTEAGLAGVVITDKRLVYRKFAARVEIPLSDEIVINQSPKDKHLKLTISSPHSKSVNLITDESGAERLRLALRQQGANLRWNK